jgi:hypothetical protein
MSRQPASLPCQLSDAPPHIDVQRRLKINFHRLHWLDFSKLHKNRLIAGQQSEMTGWEVRLGPATCLRTQPHRRRLFILVDFLFPSFSSGSLSNPFSQLFFTYFSLIAIGTTEKHVLS